MNDDLATHIESLDLGVERYGAATHIVDSDGPITSFFCGARGVRVRKRATSQKPTCPSCVHQAYRLSIKGV
jgi:hypothetical protein